MCIRDRYSVCHLDSPTSSIHFPLTSPSSVPTITLPCVCRIQRSNKILFLSLMMSDTLLFFHSLPNTSSFVTLLFQEIRSILLHVHISKTCNLSTSPFLSAYVSVPCRTTFQTIALSVSLSALYLVTGIIIFSFY